MNPRHDLAPQWENYRQYWKGWGTEYATDGAVSIYRSGIQYARLNGITHNAAHPREALEEAREHLAGVPWVWEVTDESHPETRDVLTEWGARSFGHTVVMAADLTQAPPALRTAPPAGATEWTVDGDNTGWVRGYAEAMWVPEAEIARVAQVEQTRADDGGRLVRYVFEADGEIRATTELLLADGIAGLYLVATQPAYQRRGIATALVVAALDRARQEGMTLATLQATPAGEPVYRSLGFEPVSAVYAFSGVPA